MSFEGSIGSIDLIHRLVELGREQFTGAVRFEHDGIIKIVYLKGGDVLSASTNDRTDSIDELLLRAGKIDREHLKQALSKRKENETLGDALLNLGFITRKELTWARRIQAIGILRSVRGWTSGSYTIVADYLPKREEGTLFPLAQIIVELIVTEQDRQPIEKAMDGGTAVFSKSSDFAAAFERLGLNEEAGQIAAQVDGKRSAADIANTSGKDVFNVYKLLEALRALGLLTKSQVKDEFAFETAAVSDAADAWNSRADELIASTSEGEDLDLGVPSQDEPPVREPAAPVGAAATMAKEPQWGFDEAQIEAAQKAVPPPPLPAAPKPMLAEMPRPQPVVAPRPRPSIPTQTQRKRPSPPRVVEPQSTRSRVPVFTLIFLMFIAAAGYAFWTWWSGQQTTQAFAQSQIRRPAPHVATPTPIETQIPPPHPATSVGAAATGGTPAATQKPVTTPGKPPVAAPKPIATQKPKPSAPAQTKYQVMAEEYARTASGNFTVQFELVCQTASLAKAVQAGGASVWFVPISYHGQSCYRVFWGKYGTREAAMRAWVQIPSSMRGAKPVVVPVPKP
jgi:septal ring-binding cell division protein DamX